MRVEAPKPAELPAPVEASLSDSPLRRLVSPFLSIWDRLRRVPEHPVVGLLSPEQMQTQGRELIGEVLEPFKPRVEYIHAAASARRVSSTESIGAGIKPGGSQHDVVIFARIPAADQTIALTVTEDSSKVPIALTMKAYDADKEAATVVARVETRKSEDYEPEISLKDNRPERISPKPDTVDAVAGIRAVSADLSAKLQPVVQPPV